MYRGHPSPMTRLLHAAILAAVLVVLPATLEAQEDEPPPPWARFEAGGMELQISRFGQVAHDGESDGRWGLFWPGTPPTARREDALVRGLVHAATPVLVGTVRGERRVAASYYRDVFRPGPITANFRTVSPLNPYYRPYRISIDRPDERDYREWPPELGAPIHGFRQPYFFAPRQMFWVMNDLDSVTMRQYMGSDPMGLEIRCLAWGARTGGGLDGDHIVLQFTYVNRSADTIRDAYAGFFADPDIRDGLDDMAGSDSARALVYVYDRTDGVSPLESMPTALGVCMLQTPAVPAAAGDSARWNKGWRHGWRNIPVTAGVVPLKNVSSPVREPDFGEAAPAQWDALMRGDGYGTPVRNPRTGAPARFWFSGDPVTGTGWLPRDGYLFADGSSSPQGAADQRVLISSGPFTLAPDDTQQVVVALIAARAATPRAAVHALRDRAEYLRARHLQRPAVDALENVVVTLRPDGAARTTVRVAARSAGAPLELAAEIASPGQPPELLPMRRTQVGSSWVYGADVTVASAAMGANVSVLARADGGSDVVRVPARVSVPLAGEIGIEGTHILQEGDGNGRIAPDEDARWFPLIRNATATPLRLFVEQYDFPVSEWMRTPELLPGEAVPSAAHPWRPAYGHRTVFQWDDRWGTLFDTVLTDYDVWDPDQNSWWTLRGRVPVDSSAGEWFDALMTQVRGASNERPGVRILDRGALQDRWYVVSVHGAAGARTLAMKDSASGVPLFSGLGMDVFTGMAPATDGFRVVRGTMAASRGPEAHYVPREARGAPRGFPGFSPSIVGTAVQETGAYADVLLVIDSAEGQSAIHYLDGEYHGRTALPLRVYRRTPKLAWEQVEIGLFEEFGAGTIDAWTGGDDEALLVFDVPLNYDWAPPESLPAYWENLSGLLALRASEVPDSGSYEFMFHVPADERDLYVFNPRHALLARSNKPAAAATLHPPAPTPFSAWTSAVIELQSATPLRAEVYNSLGRRVVLLRDDWAEAGRHLLVWDGRWSDGRPADAGMYLLRVQANGGEVTRKLIIVR